MKKLYYNPLETPNTARFISKEQSIDVTLHPYDAPCEYPFFFEDMFSAIKRGEFDNIIVTVTSHEGCYYPEKVSEYLYKRVPVIGEISLLDFSNGGGYLKDKHLYLQ